MLALNDALGEAIDELRVITRYVRGETLTVRTQ